MSAQPSVAAKTERLLNLVIALLSTRMPLSKQRIRAAVPQYHHTGSDEAFDRMFERDKDELRELGIPLVTEPVDPLFDDEIGYRIDRREYDLPAIAFTPDEVAALALAGRTWAQATLAAPASAALAKLASAGVPLDETSLVGIEPRIRTADPAFEPLRKAVVARQPVGFDYRTPGGEQASRLVQPWGLTMWRGRWYLTGHDEQRAAPRVFRLSRIVGAVRTRGRPGGYTVPADHQPHRFVDAFAPPQTPPEVATLRVRDGAGNTLRRRALTHEDLDDGWSRLTVSDADTGRLAAEIAGFGPHVVVDAPGALRDAVCHHLRAVLDRHGAAAAAAPGSPGTSR